MSLSIPSPASAQPLAQIVEAATAEKELLTYATTQAWVMNRLAQGFYKKYPFRRAPCRRCRQPERFGDVVDGQER